MAEWSPYCSGYKKTHYSDTHPFFTITRTKYCVKEVHLSSLLDGFLSDRCLPKFHWWLVHEIWHLVEV